MRDGTHTDRPADHQAIKEINHRREIDLASGNFESCEVCQVMRICHVSVEVPMDGFFRCRTDFSKVRTVALF